MSFKRSSENPPDHYEKLTTKQKRNWRRATKKMERNEELRMLYPPFTSSSNINIIHIHRLSTIHQVDELISKATLTKRCIDDTESERGKQINQGALIQIQFVHTIHHSTVILLEVNYLPDRTSTLFIKIKELCTMIFNNNNGIITWGEYGDEFKHFHYLDLIHAGNINHKNLEFLFSNPNADIKTHPERKRRDNENRKVLICSTPSDNVYYNILDDDIFNDIRPKQVKPNHPISLQSVIATTFEKFLDKSLTYNYCKCGLDVQLNTWKTKLFNRKFYDEQLEKHQRQLMIQYAVRDCTAVAKLYLHMFPEKVNEYQTTPETPKATTTTSKINNDLSDISEDELVEILKSDFHQKQLSSQQSNKQQQQQEENTQQPAALSKAEKKRKIENIKKRKEIVQTLLID